jgi:hypothetical protein
VGEVGRARLLAGGLGDAVAGLRRAFTLVGIAHRGFLLTPAASALASVFAFLPVAFATLSRDWPLIASGNLPEAIRPFPPLAACRSFAAAKASNRAIATTLGVDEKTVRNDARAEKSAPAPKKPSDNNVAKSASAENSAPPAPAPSISGAAAANLVHRREVGAAERKERVKGDVHLRPIA